MSGAGSKTALQLARKRARDRRAQQAMRDRTKRQLEALRIQVEDLSQQVSRRDAEPIIAASTRIISLHHSEQYLQQPPNSAVSPTQELILTGQRPQASSSATYPAYHGLTLDPSILECWHSQTQTPGRCLSASNSTLSRSHPRVLTPIHLSDTPELPWNVSPTCPADRIMQPFLEEKRQLVQSLLNSTPSPIPTGGTPAWKSAIQCSISKVAADLLSTYSEIDHLPKKLACLYVISHVLNVISPHAPPYCAKSDS
jgi:hypothetical protein